MNLKIFFNHGEEITYFLEYIVEFMVLDHLEVANSKIFWGFPPGPTNDIAN